MLCVSSRKKFPTVKFNPLWDLIGNTPMVEIKYKWKGQVRSVFAKCEYHNHTGSIKDRMALYILQQAYADGQLAPGDVIVEASSGNTGIALASIGKWLGHRVVVFMPDWLSPERVRLIRTLGAEVLTVSRKEGGFLGSIRLAEELATKQKNVFLPRQFANPLNTEAHERTTGNEICLQLAGRNVAPDAFVAGVGTGGTVMGVGKYLKARNKKIFIHPIEPAESPTLSTGYKTGTHRIQGISDEFIPHLLDLRKLDPVIAVHDGDAICLAQKLANTLGLGVGISSGANFLGVVALQNKIGGSATVVTVFCDSNKKYLSTDLTKDEPVLDNFLTPHIELLSYATIGRLNPTIL